MFFILGIERERLKEGRLEARWRGERIRGLMKGEFLISENWKEGRRDEEMEREIGRERERRGEGEEEKAMVFRGKWEGC